MFNIGMMELLLVLLVAFLVVGPKDLPKVARWIARQVKSLRRLIREIKAETGWDEFVREFRDTKEDIESVVKDADITAEINDAAAEVRSAVEDVRQEVGSVQQEVDAAVRQLNDEVKA